MSVTHDIIDVRSIELLCKIKQQGLEVCGMNLLEHKIIEIHSVKDVTSAFVEHCGYNPDEPLLTVNLTFDCYGLRKTKDVTFWQSTFEKVKEALSLLDEGENSIRHNRSRDIPKLRLGASSTLTRYVLLSHLENYIARFPHVRITISCQSTYQTLQLLDEEKIDLGLIGRPQKLRGYYFQPLLKIQDTFVCTQQYLENQKKLYPDEPLIQAATFMMLDEDNITRQTVNTQLKEHHVELSHILEVTTMDLLIQFAEIGLGIACVIRDFVKKELEEGTLVEVPVGFSFPLREIGFVCRQKDADSALIAPFFDDETEHPDK